MQLQSRSLFALTALAGAALAGLSSPVGAQPQETSPAPSIRIEAAQERLLELSDVALHTTPVPSLSALVAEDLIREAEGQAPRYAVPESVQISPSSHGTWETLSDGRLIWRMRIEAPRALSINLGFERYQMPAGGQLHLYSSDLQRFVRPFTSADNELHGQLWTPPVPTEELVLEVVLPAETLDQLELVLTQIGYGYRGFNSGVEESTKRSGSCNVDTVCPEGDDWRAEIPSVGVISTGGGTFCTGFMVNNVRGDGKPFFMTAAHCGIRAGNAASLVVFWNYENSTCRAPGSGSSGGSGNGSLSQFNTGSTHLATYSPSDFTLVELDDVPDPSFNVAFAGWDATGADADMAIAIHHPNTDEKRISFEDQATTTTTYLQNAIPGDGTHVRVTDWDLGTTEPGSSGSPLFNQDHRVIGQLHGGFASCTSQTSDWYGKVSVSWNGGGSSSTQLKTWLDPDNTGSLIVDTLGARVMGRVAGYGLDAGGANDARLRSTTEPIIGDPMDFDLSLFPNSSAASLIISLNQASLPLNGGTLLVDLSTKLVQMSVALAGGSATRTLIIPLNVSLVGMTVYSQAGAADATQPGGLIFTNGMSISVGEPSS